MHHHYQSHDTVYVHLQKCLYIYASCKNECQCYSMEYHSFSDSVSKFEGVILNTQCVEVSVVNIDASTSFVFGAALYQLGSQVVMKYDHMCVYTVDLYLMY